MMATSNRLLLRIATSTSTATKRAVSVASIPRNAFASIASASPANATIGTTAVNGTATTAANLTSVSRGNLSSRRCYSSPSYFGNDDDNNSNINTNSNNNIYDDGIRTGSIQTFKNQYGFILPDDAAASDYSDDDLLFIHVNDVLTTEVQESPPSSLSSSSSSPSFSSNHRLLKTGTRVQFKVGPPNRGATKKKAYALTLEGGERVPLYHSKAHFRDFVRRQKAKFGDEIYEIMCSATNTTTSNSNSNSTTNTTMDKYEMEARIVEAYERTKASIDRRKKIMSDVRSREDASGGLVKEDKDSKDDNY